MFEQVQAKLAAVFKVDPARITPETNIRTDLKADSVVIMGLVFELEDEYNVVIPTERAKEMEVVGSLVNYLETTLAKKKKK